MRQRVIVVYNPRSSRASQVEAEVVGKLRSLSGITLGKYEVKKTDVDDNSRRLAKIIEEGDVVLVAGGDGTGTIALNGIMLSGREVRFGVLGYGNFNDMARTLSRGRSKDEILKEVMTGGRDERFYPLKVEVDGKHFRYAGCYVTLGMLAESTELFDGEKQRKHLRRAKKNLFYSLRELAKWYLKNRRREFLPALKLNGKEKKGTDYIAVNGKTVARIMKGGDWFLAKEGFVSSVKNLRGIAGVTRFMIGSIFGEIKGERTLVDEISFDREVSVEIQAEGEYRKLERVRKVKIMKVERGVEIL